MDWEFEKEEYEEDLLDPELRELRNKNKTVPLAMRLFKPEDKKANDML
jgi:hypothetical protein